MHKLTIEGAEVVNLICFGEKQWSCDRGFGRSFRLFARAESEQNMMSVLVDYLKSINHDSFMRSLEKRGIEFALENSTNCYPTQAFLIFLKKRLVELGIATVLSDSEDGATLVLSSSKERIEQELATLKDRLAYLTKVQASLPS